MIERGKEWWWGPEYDRAVPMNFSDRSNPKPPRTRYLNCQGPGGVCECKTERPVVVHADMRVEVRCDHDPSTS